MNQNHTLRAVAAVTCTVTLAALSACSGSPEEPKAASAVPQESTSVDTAVDTDPVVLRLGTGDNRDAPSADQIRDFADRVEAASDGSLQIKPMFEVAAGNPRFETAVARQVGDGELDLAIVAARAWDTVGVETLTPLNAPFLVTTDDLVSEIVTSDLADELMSGLPEAGVEGLALFPEGLRHPFGFGKPMLSPADFEGELVRAPWSRTSEAMFGALGARTTAEDVDPSTQRGAESSYRLTPAGIATGNVTFYPKVNVLVAFADLQDALTDEQWGALQEAADGTRDWNLDDLPSDTEAARTFCKQSGEIVGATGAQVADLERQTAPVLDQLRDDPVTGPIVEQIEQLKAGIGDTQVLTACPEPPAPQEESQLNGVYEMTNTAKEFHDEGVHNKSKIDENAGDYTITLKDGSWQHEQVYSQGPSAGDTYFGSGDYTYEDGRLTWYWSHEPGMWTKADVSIAKDGSLTFSKQADGEGPIYVLMSRVHFDEWKRVGDAP